MGLRFKKSVNLGGGLKLNLSKSGIGWSFGFKGFRIGKTAKGTTRTTATLPGTGLSYVKESKVKNKKTKKQNIIDSTFDDVVNELEKSNKEIKHVGKKNNEEL